MFEDRIIDKLMLGIKPDHDANHPAKTVLGITLNGRTDRLSAFLSRINNKRIAFGWMR